MTGSAKQSSFLDCNKKAGLLPPSRVAASADFQPGVACAASVDGSSRSLSSGARSRDPLAPHNDGEGTCTLERQPDVILGKRTRRRLRADEIVQLRLLDPLAEFALIREFVQHRGRPP